jgi:hypothetical protein
MEARSRPADHPRPRRTTLLTQLGSKDQPLHHVQGLDPRHLPHSQCSAACQQPDRACGSVTLVTCKRTSAGRSLMRIDDLGGHFRDTRPELAVGSGRIMVELRACGYPVEAVDRRFRLRVPWHRRGWSPRPLTCIRSLMQVSGLAMTGGFAHRVSGMFHTVLPAPDRCLGSAGGRPGQEARSARGATPQALLHAAGRQRNDQAAGAGRLSGIRVGSVLGRLPGWSAGGRGRGVVSDGKRVRAASLT